ncbi:hypothetical protein BG015_001626 [Linnemannia schmuckeri]|uniref:Uncharacterized protein n=1 Tax=Linnemannia schmuckeri TaxID=64567 RepID=A0A9P5S9D5_9FUNG|nr:hypothetical protein BG015_001626 [Linnemannia schmuckeri]
MKITAVSAVLCLAVSAMAANIPQPTDASTEASTDITSNNNMDKRATPIENKAASIDKKAHSEHNVGAHKDTSKKNEKNAAEAKDEKDKNAEPPAQKEQIRLVPGHRLHHLLGLNPDSGYAKNIASKSPAGIRLMQGPPDKLKAAKSNVGVPLEIPKKGDVPQPLNKGPIYQPAAPPNLFPAAKLAATPVGNNPASPPRPTAAKPVVNGVATTSHQ